MKNKQEEKEPRMATVGMMKMAFSRDPEVTAFERVFWFGLGAVIFPFELVKVGLEGIGVEFDNGDGKDFNPYDH